MRKQDVRTPEDAFCYILDCTLATVSSMASIKSRKQGEFRRQILIAQTGIDWVRSFKIKTDEGRISEVIEYYHGEVGEWAKRYLPENFMVTK